MPRKAPDKVIEHRITLGQYEREELRQVVRRYRQTSVANSVGNVLSGVGWPVLAGAALLYVGFSLDDLIEKTKDYIDRASDGVVNFVEDNDLVVYTAPYIGQEIKEIEEEKVRIYTERQEYFDANADVPGIYSGAKAQTYKAKLERLQRREEVLTRMLDKIAKGEAVPYSYVTFFDSGGFLNTTQGDKTIDRTLQEFYEEEGGEGDFDQ